MNSEVTNVNNENIVNVIDEFDYSTQNESYNEKFRKWRRKKENPFSFNFAENKKESVYIDGRGFIESSAVSAEKKVLSNIFYFIGLALLMYIAFDDVISKIVISLLSFFGIDIHNNYFSSIIYGGSTEIVTVFIIITFIKIIIPLIFLHFKFRLPLKVEFMWNMNNPMALIGAISMTLILCTISSLPTIYSSETKEIYEFFKNLETDVSVWGQTEFLVYTIFDIIVMSVLSEMLFRGAIFAVLRQFGDPFAVIITSIIAGLLTQNFNTMLTVILISFVASYGMISSGTIFTPVCVVVIYKIYNLTLTVIEIDPSEKMPLTRNIFMIFMLIIGGAGLVAYCIYIAKKKKSGIARYKSELHYSKRFIFSVKTFPFSAVSVLCVVCALVKAVF